MQEHFTVHWYPETWGKKTENQLIFFIKILVYKLLVMIKINFEDYVEISI